MNKEKALRLAFLIFNTEEELDIGNKKYTVKDVWDLMEEDSTSIKRLLKGVHIGTLPFTEYVTSFDTCKTKLLTTAIDKWFEDGCPDGSEDTLGE